LISIDKNMAKNITCCPACGSKNIKELFKLPKYVKSNAYEVCFEALPSIIKCSECFLQFKNPVYDTSLDLMVYQQYSSGMKKRWRQPILPKDLINILKGYKKGTIFLEVGPGENPISKICSDGIHYTLDIDQSHVNTSSSKSIIGSIDRFIDDKFRNMFDVVVMFDIAEHVTDVETMFFNLHKILKPGGELIIETGDALSDYAIKLKNNWKYYSIPEHRVFLSKECVSMIAPKNGFKIVELLKVRHKGIRSFSGFLLKLLAFLKWKILKGWILQKTSINNQQIFLTPDLPHTKDHIFVKLLKEL
jgi:SAM-dependent methyltransferase